MAKLSTKQASRTHRVLLYGAPKTGKTQLAGELSEYFNLIWIDMENGHETLFKFPQAWQERIELVSLRDTRSYPIAIETVLKLIKGPVDICDTHGKVACMVCLREKEKADWAHVDVTSMDANTIIVFDSLTQLTTSAINNITKKESDDYKMQTDDWMGLSKLIDIFATTVQAADYNVICISHETEAETEGKKNILVPVAGSRNSSRNIAKAFDHVIYCERKNRKHVFASGTTYATNILTGSRTDVAMEDLAKDAKPSLLAIFKPELYGKAKVAEVAAKTPVATKEKTSDILSRLTQLKKK